MKGMKFNRREFLFLGGAAVASFMGISGIDSYLNDSDMKRPPAQRNSKKGIERLVDLHAHIGKDNKLEDIASLITQGGGIGLAARNGNPKILSYEEFLGFKLPGLKIDEVSAKTLARVEYHGNIGFVFRVQEINSKYHVLSVGFKGNYLKDWPDPKDAIDNTRDHEGRALMAHMGFRKLTRISVKPFGSVDKFRVLDKKEQEEMKGFLRMADEGERFISFGRNFLPKDAYYILRSFLSISPQTYNSLRSFCDFEEANRIAAKLCDEDKDKKGTYGSDAHYRLEQVQKAGVYVLEKYFTSITSFFDCIRTGDFTYSDKTYISRMSVIKGAILSNLKSDKSYILYNN